MSTALLGLARDAKADAALELEKPSVEEPGDFYHGTLTAFEFLTEPDCLRDWRPTVARILAASLPRWEAWLGANYPDDDWCRRLMAQQIEDWCVTWRVAVPDWLQRLTLAAVVRFPAGGAV